MRRDFLRLNLALYCFATAHSCGLRRYSRGNAAILVALPQRIRAGCDETLSEYAPEHELCHSAFVRVATPAAAGRTAPEDFATAHSCGLRLTSLTPQQFADCFATAHSCGLRPHQKNPLSPDHPLCHSAFVRVATMNSSKHILLTFALPQRIRAGCDLASSTRRRPKMLCHSAFVRVATVILSSFVSCVAVFATAHSCGLRPGQISNYQIADSLPQRIRAGCDCGKAMQRTANLLREGR